METATNRGLWLHRATSGDYEAVLGLMDRAFDRPSGRPLRQDFPTALDETNRQWILVGEEDGAIVCAAAALVRPWRVADRVRLTACLGCFATDELARGRGLSGELQRYTLELLEEARVEWALLWTDRPGIFASLALRPVGRETHAMLTPVRWPTPGAGESIRRAHAGDAPAILRLYERHAMRAERSLGDMERYLAPSTSEVHVLERGGRVVAYGAVGKGLDFAAYVHDYGGDVDDVHRLWGHAWSRGAARMVLVPAGAEGYLSGPANDLPTRRQAAALGRPIGAGGEELIDSPFAVWGFDSA